MTSIFDDIKTEKERKKLLAELMREKSELIIEPGYDRITFFPEYIPMTKEDAAHLNCSEYNPKPLRQTHEFKVFLKKNNILGLFDYCCVCGWHEAAVDMAHIIADKDGGKYALNNIVPLCPNHHRTFDRKLMPAPEIDVINSFIEFLTTYVLNFNISKK